MFVLAISQHFNTITPPNDENKYSSMPLLLPFSSSNHKLPRTSGSAGKRLCPKSSAIIVALSKTHRNLSKLQSSPLFQPDQNDNDITTTSSSSDDANEFQGFNPVTPGAKIPTKGGFGILSDADRKQPLNNQTPGGQISPRQMKMKELTTELLLNISDDDMISKLLLSNEEFLLEQLDNVDAVLEPDSVLTPDMTREGRFRQYEKVMNERITGARAPVAKKALGVLRDFVLSRE